MNQVPAAKKKKPLFTVIAVGCLLVASILFYLFFGQINGGETLNGYGGLGISLSFTTALLLNGVILGQIALFRGEKPAAFPALVLACNLAGAIFLLLQLGA